MSAPREDDLAELEAQARRNLADAVAELAGVLVMKIQAGQTPPPPRGRHLRLVRPDE
ncbi:hypothetical protein [Actinomadura sp. BRA 177]|uniref:hypothetical protein n=1 Tax=Actinomadura sp. BRA 177 TaxID=2745202 RepID=UPI00159576C4|nr:hypothetical protein [Actinomadura sp. BRA 177]NVI88250.1 hypothetical protein [Actinomadura sp. BRA 177]